MESIWSFVLSKTLITCEMDKTWWNPVSFSSFISKSCDSKLAWCSCTDPGRILMDSSFSSLLIRFRSVWTSCSALSVKVERVCLMSDEKRPSEATQVIRSLNIHVVIKLWAGLQNPWPAAVAGKSIQSWSETFTNYREVLWETTAVQTIFTQKLLVHFTKTMQRNGT